MHPRLAILIAILLIAAGVGFFVWQNPQTGSRVQQEIQNIIAETNGVLPFTREISTPPPLRGPLEQIDSTLSAGGTFIATNAQRQQNNVTSLKRNAALDQAAQNKVDDMFAKQYFDHVSPDGTTPAEVVEAAGYIYITTGENLALGNFASDTALVEAWMNSPGHRANILNSGYQEIGIAVGKGNFEGHTTWLAVQEFGTPASACPLPNQSLKNTIDNNTATATALQNELAQQQATLDAQAARVRELMDEAKTLADQGNAKIAEGNQQIQTGNQVYEETGDRAKAQPYWDKGEALQAEGEALLDQANQKIAEAKSTQESLSALQNTYNTAVSKYNELTQTTKDVVNQYNTQVNQFNICVEELR